LADKDIKNAKQFKAAEILITPAPAAGAGAGAPLQAPSAGQ